MIMLQRLFFALALAVVANAEMVVVGLLPKKIATHPQPSLLKIRGGAGPLDPTNVAKVGMVVGGLQGAYGMLAPSKNAEMFGIKSSPMMDALAEGMSTLAVSVALTAGLSIVRGTSLSKAVGVGLVPLLITNAKGLLNEQAKELGTSANGQVLTATINALVAYACLSDSSYADTAIKLYAVWGLANGLGMFFMPSEIGKAWRVSGDDFITFGVKALGMLCICYGLLLGSLAQGVDALKAYGYVWAASTVASLSFMFVTKEVSKLGMDMTPNLFYLVLGAVIAGTLAF